LLPFLKLNNQSASSGIMTKMRKPDEKPADPEAKQPSEHEQAAQEGLEACAKDLIRAIHAQDLHGVVDAIRSSFEILESLPHEEVEHDNSFKSQNVKAAQEIE
jgi:hypothetical protein